MSARHVPLRGVRVAVFAAETGTVLLATAAFVLSFTALRDLAQRSGIDPELAWLWPFIVDGIIVVATVSVFALAGTRVVWYPWMLLILGAAVSVVANAIHAVVAAEPGAPPILAASVASVPPIVLVASTHLTAVLIRHNRTIYAVATAASDVPEPIVPTTVSRTGDSPSSVTAEGGDAGAASSEPSMTQHTPVQETGSDSRRELGSQLWAEGLRKAEIARLLGVNRSTVTRWNLPDLPEQENAA
ncbi:DUF2637 domain-containing protein [Leucobacter triazinivorans]|uniref:DUF2637 domain-containing protein n=1 Tax=Leucobacter triazinivorans TaxID=1784719 RepID=A0A4P6KDH4_9MICO|nr:DUF2637 domain-containing protein [Leucobacter triazinivorans]QBE48272.1 DUF2637 domain-containing protein [Leucobacter triazinivorans]